MRSSPFVNRLRPIVPWSATRSAVAVGMGEAASVLVSPGRLTSPDMAR